MTTTSRIPRLRPRGAVRTAWLALAALTLAACITDGAERPPAAPAMLGELSALPRPAAVPSEPAAPVAWRERAPAPLGKLVGLDDAALHLLLGPPGLKRREPPAELWLYAGEGCTLHLFLYQGPAGAYRVVHAEVRPLGERDACLERLIGERQPQPRSS